MTDYRSKYKYYKQKYYLLKQMMGGNGEEKDIPIPNDDGYCINLFYFNKNPQSMIPVGKIIERYNKWKQHNKNVFFWYDSKYINTSDLQKLQDQGINIQDIREKIIDTMSNEHKRKDGILRLLDDASPGTMFSPGKIKAHIFLRVDFLKNVIALHQLNAYAYVILTDLDILDEIDPTPVSLISDNKNNLKEFKKDQIFDKNTLTLLDRFGVVFAEWSNGIWVYENSFMIFKNQDIIRNELQKTMIDKFLFLRDYYRGKGEFKKEKALIPRNLDFNYQIIYDMYKIFFQRILLSKKYITFKTGDIEITSINDFDNLVLEYQNPKGKNIQDAFYLLSRQLTIIGLSVEIIFTDKYTLFLKTLGLIPEEFERYMPVKPVKTEVSQSAF